MRGVVTGAVILSFLAVATACGDSGVDPLPLSVRLTPDRTEADVGTEIAFDYAGQGEALVGILIAFGDGAVDTINAFGARTAEGTRRHTYLEAGTFDAIATIVDRDLSTGGQTTATGSARVTVRPR